MSKIEETHFLIPETHSDLKNNFYKYYKPLKSYSELSSKAYVGSEDICRYCGETDRKHFKKDNSHTFPECTGNKWLFSKDECVNCNQIFSQYENELANHGHVMRTFLGMKTKKGGATKYKTESFKIQRLDNGFVMNIFDKQNKPLDKEKHGEIIFYADFEKEEDGAKIVLPEKKFIPSYLFKCLAKIGLGIMPDSELLGDEFNDLKSWLIKNEDGSQDDNPYLYVYYSKLPFGDRKPIIQIFKKLDEFDKLAIPMYSLFFAYGNDMFQIFLPNCKSDAWIFDLRKVSLPIIPFFIGNSAEQRGFRIIDGNITEKGTFEAYKSFMI